MLIIAGIFLAHSDDYRAYPYFGTHHETNVHHLDEFDRY